MKFCPCCQEILFFVILGATLYGCDSTLADEAVLPDTAELRMQGDLASQMVEGIDRFLLNELARSVNLRANHWQRDTTSPEAYTASIEPNRGRLAHMLGLRDVRTVFESPALMGTVARPALVGRGRNFDVFAIRWPAFGDVTGEGLLLTPRVGRAHGDIISIPDADQQPEQLAGLVDGIPVEAQFARQLAENGYRVIVPTLINRHMERRAPPGGNGRSNLTNREFLHRSAYELGRHLVGYEIQKTLALVDWLTREAGQRDARIGVIGYGEGGLVAFYAAALDPRIDAACVSGYWGSRQRIWQEPIERNAFGLLEQFGDAEIASLIAPRGLIIDSYPGPELTLPSDGGAPAELRWHAKDEIRQEKQRLLDLLGDLPRSDGQPGLAAERLVIETEPGPVFCAANVLRAFVEQLGEAPALETVAWEIETSGELVNDAARQQRQIHEIDRHNQWLLGESPYVRAKFFEQLDTSSLAAYQRSIEPYRDTFREEVIGSFSQPLMPPQPRSRQSYDEATWTGYEIVLDVFPDVFAYGILCVPKSIPAGERRPVVVCQHGLEGRPQDVVAGDHRAYHDFAAKLAERGFITFAPQNIYIFRDRFRTLQRKAYPLKKTLFSVMVPQHQQIVNWLKTLPQVDPERIAFYGLSYGGKSAMRIPPLVTDYCLSICSADFNEWVAKNASTRATQSYVWTGEYEIFEFDLGSTFNYAEMAALIAPRPFMVERGHFDGVATDEAVAYEFAKVRRLYQAQLGIGDRCAIEWFVGPHTIHGQGTFEFLHRHLNWP